MKQHVALQAVKLGAPGLWGRILWEFLGVDRRLAVELWRKLYPSEAQPLMFQMSRVQASHAHELSILNLRSMLTPKVLLELCRRLAPEDGQQQRRRDVVELEEAILERTTTDGEWV